LNALRNKRHFKQFKPVRLFPCEVILIRMTFGKWPDYKLSEIPLNRGVIANCVEFVKDDGLDFFVEGTNEFRVCERCATKKAPELAFIHEHAHRWQEVALEKAFEDGVACGKTTAGKKIYLFNRGTK